MWAGAAVLNPTGKIEEILQRANICSIINGKLANCYSKKDYILKYAFMKVMSDFPPIGIIPIFDEIPEDYCKFEQNALKLKKAFNYDCTKEAPGHTAYSDNCNLILDKIPYSF